SVGTAAHLLVTESRLAACFLRRTSMTRSRSAVAHISAAILLLPVSLCSIPVSAQEATGGVQDADSASSGRLEEVTVTATRREETQSKVPISITAFTQEQMDSQGLRQVDDLVRFTPGLNINRAGNGGN